jgi:hypothetical protein
MRLLKEIALWFDSGSELIFDVRNREAGTPFDRTRELGHFADFHRSEMPANQVRLRLPEAPPPDRPSAGQPPRTSLTLRGEGEEATASALGTRSPPLHVGT